MSIDPSKGVEVSSLEAPEKAHVIQKRHKHECTICRLLDTENLTIKWHIYSESYAADEPDSEICDDCLKDIENIRTRSRLKIDNPNHDPFASFIPKFIEDMPNLKGVFTKLFS